MELWYDWQKQAPEVFNKKSCSQKFGNINRKTSVLESLFHKVGELQACIFIKTKLQHRCFSAAKFLQNIDFEERLHTKAPELILRSDCLKFCFWTVAFKTILTLEYVHMRSEMNSNWYEISFWLKISIRCSVSSLFVFTWIEVKWNSKQYGFHIVHFDQNEISNRHEIFMWT